MTFFKAILLGIIQGITEFLPISSSGHLVLSQNLLGISEPGVTLEVMLHFGTLLSILVWFRRDLAYLIRGGLSLIGVGKNAGSSFYTYQGHNYRKLVLLIIVGTFPAVILAFSFRETFEQLYDSTLSVGVALLFTGSIIWGTTKTYRARKTLQGMNIFDAVLVGIGQALAIVPGLSRSGMTITSGLLLGLERELAVKFSFLLAVPVILGAAILEVKSLTMLSTDTMLPIISGTLASFLAGLLAIKFLVEIVKRGKMQYFAYYCWVVGVIVVVSGVF